MYKSSALLIDFEAHHGLGNGNLVSHRCWQCQPTRVVAIGSIFDGV